MRTLLGLLLRAVVTGVLAVIAGRMPFASTPDAVGADLGPGLMAFLVAAVVALLWAFADAVRGRSFPATLGLWAAVGVVLGLAAALSVLRSPGQVSVDFLVGELLPQVVFGAVLLGLPAAIGAAAGVLLRRVRGPEPRPRAGA